MYQRLGECTDPNEYARRYGEAVKFADENVGMILDELKKLGKYQDSWIVITADHGESLTERELWFDHGTTPYVEQLQVPLLIKAPRSVKWTGQDDRLVSLSDVLPTILDGLELDAPIVDGFSLNISHESAHHWRILSLQIGRGAELCSSRSSWQVVFHSKQNRNIDQCR